MTKITAWSYSRWATYQECPFKAKCKFIDRLPEPPSPAAERGTYIHKLAEDYTTGKIVRIPAELKKFHRQFKKLRDSRAQCELQWAFTSDWKVTGWFSKNCWARVKTDAFTMDKKGLLIIDHKTGKQRASHEDQLSLYALAGLLIDPRAEVVTTELWYLDHGIPTTREYTRADEGWLRESWETKTRALLNDERFSPTPGPYCRWCPFKKSEGGQCQF